MSFIRILCNSLRPLALEIFTLQTSGFIKNNDTQHKFHNFVNMYAQIYMIQMGRNNFSQITIS